MGDEPCKKAARPGMVEAQAKAFELFQIAALLLGSEDEAAAAVEETIADIEIDPRAEIGRVHDEALQRLADSAVRRLLKAHPRALAAPPSMQGTSACIDAIDADDLSSAGWSSERLDALLEGPGQAKMRGWLEELTPALRAVFVLRAVARLDGERTAEVLRRAGAAGAQSWRVEQVRAAYRQALCLLASSLVSSSFAVLPT